MSGAAEVDLIRHPHGITAVDTHYMRPLLDASHVIEQGGRAAFVDTGTNHSVPHLLRALEVLGIAREAVDWVFLTHVHLDHAGGVGTLMQSLPNARVVVHPRGAPHMAEPAKLIAASIAVYGEAAYRELYGELVPIPVERIVAAQDGQAFDLGGRRLECLYTPGHALHHQIIVDRANALAFTGDTFGLSYREFDVDGRAMVVPTTTPTQFDPAQLLASIDRICALEPAALYLTHYSRITDIARLAASLRHQVGALVSAAEAAAAATWPDRAECKRRIVAAIRALWVELARSHGVAEPDQKIEQVLGFDLELNAAGLIAWLERAKATR
jgi:glyoxylase-like metal-dependent hydrolase (beta-lactamase superfamily II)